MIDEWHAPIGHAVLGSFGLPEAILVAVAEHEGMRYGKPLKTLRDVITVANLLSRCSNPLNPRSSSQDCEVDDVDVLGVVEDSAEDLRSLVATLSS